MDWVDRIGRRVKLRDLHVLLAVTQWGSMAKAARHLSTSQPVISKTIAELEHALGVRLLDRSPQGIVPTMYGRALMSRGLAIFDELREGIKEIEFLADPARDVADAGGDLGTVDQRPRFEFRGCLGAGTGTGSASHCAHYATDLRGSKVSTMLAGTSRFRPGSPLR